MQQTNTRRSCLLRGLSLLAVAAITFAIVLNEDRMEDIAALGYVGAFLAMLLSNATLILPAPGLVFVFALGGTLNPFGVGLFAAVGATLGEVTGYLTGYSGVAVIDGNLLAERVRLWVLVADGEDAVCAAEPGNDGIRHRREVVSRERGWR